MSGEGAFLSNAGAVIPSEPTTGAGTVAPARSGDPRSAFTDGALEAMADLAKLDSWHLCFVGSDIRQLIGECQRHRAAMAHALTILDVRASMMLPASCDDSLSSAPSTPTGS